ncbi:MAG: WG repeat-containing protein [Clostridium sp.]|nr:WG repeat-containing protein [Clostridium sp.]
MKIIKHRLLQIGIATAIMVGGAFINSLAAIVEPKLDSQKNLWGYVQADGKWAIKPKFDKAGPYVKMPNGKELSEVRQKGLIGYVDANGKILGPGVVFESVSPLDGEAMLVSVKGKQGIINCDGIYLIKPELTDMESLGGDGYIVSIKDKKGVVDRQGKTIIPIEYDEVDAELPGYFKLMKGGKCGLTDRKGTFLIAPGEYTNIQQFGDYWKVSKDDKKGLLNHDGSKIIVKAEYSDIDQPIIIKKVMYTPVEKNGKWGIIDSTGTLAKKCEYSSVQAFPSKDFIYLTRVGNKPQMWFASDGTTLNGVIEQDEEIGPFRAITGYVDTPASSDRIGARIRARNFPEGRLTLLLNTQGELVSDQSTNVKKVGRNYIVGGNGRPLTVLDTEGNTLIDGLQGSYEQAGEWLIFPTYAISPEGKKVDALEIGDMRLMKGSDSKWHVLQEGALKETGYDEVAADGDKANVKRDGRWGILKNGKETVRCLYSEPVVYDADLKGYTVKENDRVGLIVNKTGKTIHPEYDEIECLLLSYNDTDFYRVKRNGLTGLVSDQGEEIYEPKYTTLVPHDIADNMWAQNNGKFGVVDTSGNILIPVEYADEELNIIEDKYYYTDKGGKRIYYYNSGLVMPQTKKAEITSQELEHNIWDANGNKALRINYSLGTEFCQGQIVNVTATAYYKDGAVAKNRSGKVIKHTVRHEPSYIFNSTSGWITLPNSNFQHTAKRHDFYIKLTVTDGNGKAIPTTGNDKMHFNFTY